MGAGAADGICASVWGLAALTCSGCFIGEVAGASSAWRVGTSCTDAGKFAGSCTISVGDGFCSSEADRVNNAQDVTSIKGTIIADA